MSEAFAMLLGSTSVVEGVVAYREAKGIWLTCFTTTTHPPMHPPPPTTTTTTTTNQPTNQPTNQHHHPPPPPPPPTTTTGLAQDRGKWKALVNMVMNLQVPETCWGVYIMCYIYRNC
jgi:hypothetical protein